MAEDATFQCFYVMARAAEIDRRPTAPTSQSEKTASGFFLEFYIFFQDFGKKCDKTGYFWKLWPKNFSF